MQVAVCLCGKLRRMVDAVKLLEHITISRKRRANAILTLQDKSEPSIGYRRAKCALAMR